MSIFIEREGTFLENTIQNRKIRHRVTAVLLVLVLFNSFLFFLNIDLGFFIMTPIRLFLIACTAYLGVSHIRLLITYWKMPKGKRPPLKVFFTLPVYFLILIFLWAGYAGIWLVFSHLNEFGKAEFIGIGTLFLFSYCFLSLVQDSEDVRFVCKGIVISCVVLAFCAILETMFGTVIPGDESYIFALREKINVERTLFPPTAGFGNTNDLIAVLSIGFVILQYQLIKAATWKESRRALILLLILLLPTILINSTIFNAVFCILSLFTLLVIFFYRKKDVHRGMPADLYLKKIIVYLIVLAAYYFLIRHAVRFVTFEVNKMFYEWRITNYMQSDPRFHGELSRLNNNNLNQLSDNLESQLSAFRGGYGTIHIRLWLIAFGMQIVAAHPFFGAGPGNYRTLIRQSPHVLKNTRNDLDPHNFYIELASEFGLIFFFAFAILFALMLSRTWRAVKKAFRAGVSSPAILSMLMLLDAAMICVLSSSIIRFTSLWLLLLIPVAILNVLMKQGEIPSRRLHKSSAK